ncbi:MAG: coproporphyrinogen dehydrogenase HemZ [Oscillospiraceae bacterium]|jgi:oxygen-independent coproporphyrinogen-3 oxidase|nr:coproporphyrinogen dehydrogenase HemZ [Oscillospiraceae bacterium]
MILYCSGHAYHYELENLCRVFCPAARVAVRRREDCKPPAKITRQVAQVGFVVFSRMEATACGWRVEVLLVRGTARFRLHRFVEEQTQTELAFAQLLYCLLLRALRAKAPPWGLLTGVRPSKLMRRLQREEGEQTALRRFRDVLWVSAEKTELARCVAAAEAPVLALTAPQSFSLYTSIPFCPSRCSYCSFVSHTVDRASAQKLISPYLDCLCAELEATAAITARLGLRLESVYVGGGTPAVLEAEQLARLCGTVNRLFGQCAEFTVEAGRPDVITKEKLLALRESGVNRVSVNPQSLRDDVLRRAGRLHTAAQCVESYMLARATGFEGVNMDLIAGLPGDDPAGFAATLREILALRPENITMHTLAIKRAADLRAQAAQTGHRYTERMLALAAQMLPAAGYAPYYMYRQSRSLGNLENIGWSLPDKLCRYNIDMMEESHTVLGCGAGAVTKLKAPHSDLLERVFCFKYPYEYLSRFQEVLARKARIEHFYSRNTMIQGVENGGNP